MSLTEVLPVEPGDPDHAAAELLAPGAGERLQRGQRLGGSEHPTRASLGRAHVALHGQLAPPLGRDQDPPGALPQRRRAELPAVEALSRQPDEQVALAGPRASRSRRGRGRRSRRLASTSAPAAEARRSPSKAIQFGGGLRELAQLLPGHVAVVERDLPPILELLALLVPLAGDHHRVALAARTRASAIAARRSCSTATSPRGLDRGSRPGSAR